jgi:hypothetical protein
MMKKHLLIKICPSGHAVDDLQFMLSQPLPAAITQVSVVFPLVCTISAKNKLRVAACVFLHASFLLCTLVSSGRGLCPNDDQPFCYTSCHLIGALLSFV